ncbi:MAG: hypothetical protein HY000_01580 [Planctomycetes bacterium]|nr:hypothetical protein [Planctomycetota bacterium]
MVGRSPSGFGFMAMPAYAQSDGEAEVRQLRRRLEQLERQLQAGGENSQDRPEGRRKVTEIGERPMPSESRQLIRVYDIGDLFVLAPLYEATRESDLGPVTGPVFREARQARQERRAVGGGLGGGGLGGGGGFLDVDASKGAGEIRSLPQRGHVLHQAGRRAKASTSPSADEGAIGAAADLRPGLDALMEAITESIDPHSWEAAGGNNTIKELGNALIVSAPRDVHDKIDGLLALLRERWGTLRTVSVRGYWVWLTDTEVERLLAEEPQAAQPGAGTQRFQGVVNREAWRQLLGEIAKGDRPAGYRASLTCYNGQTVYTVCDDQSLAVTGLVAVAGENTYTHQPETSVVQEGAALQVTPSATASGKHVVLDLHSRVSRSRPAAKAPVDKPAEFAPTSIDRPRVMTQRLATTLRIPANRPVLVGGMTFEAPMGSQASAPATLYLVVEAAVQELKDEPAPAQPQQPREEEKPKGQEKPKADAGRE